MDKKESASSKKEKKAARRIAEMDEKVQVKIVELLRPKMKKRYEVEKKTMEEDKTEANMKCLVEKKVKEQKEVHEYSDYYSKYEEDDKEIEEHRKDIDGVKELEESGHRYVNTRKSDEEAHGINEQV